MLLNPFTLHTPKTIKEAAKLLSELESVRIQAGGTFLINNLKLLKRKDSKTPEHILSLRKIDKLKGIIDHKDYIQINAMTTIDELFKSPILTGNLAILRIITKNIATTPIRNMATIGGNLTCRYTWTELPSALIGLDTQLHFTDASNKEEIIQAEEFFKNAAKTNKIFTHLTIKKNNTTTRSTYQRASKSASVDIPLFSIFMTTTIKNNHFTDTRAIINNSIAFAQRDTKLENFLNKNICSNELAEEAINHLDKSIYDTRANDYKKHLFRVHIKRAINNLVNKI